MEKINRCSGETIQENIANLEKEKIETLYNNIGKEINSLYQKVYDEITTAFEAGVSKGTLKDLTEKDFFEKAQDNIKFFTHNQQWSGEAKGEVSLMVKELEEMAQKKKEELLELVENDKKEAV